MIDIETERFLCNVMMAMIAGGTTGIFIAALIERWLDKKAEKRRQSILDRKPNRIVRW